MTCRSPKIDVSTGDYSIVLGELAEDLTAASEVILALRSKRGSSAAASWFGSRLHTITKLTKVAPKLAEAYAREALQYLVDRGAVRDLVIVATRVGRQLDLAVGYRDRTGTQQNVKYTHRMTG